MKRIAITALAFLLATPAVAEEVNRTIDADANGHVDVSNISGSVTVNGWSKNTVEVTGTIGRKVEELIVKRDGDKVRIKVKVPRHSGRGIESDLHINVPMNSSLDVGTVSADIDVAKVTGEQSLHSVSGDVNTEFTRADLEAEAVSGDIEITGDGGKGEVEATSVSGDVTLSGVSGKITAEAVSGDVMIEDGSFRRAELNTVTGEILFQGTLAEDGKLSVESVNGDVDIELAGKVSARVEIDSLNGDIDNCFGPEAQRVSKYGPGWELDFEEGDGHGRLEISTVNGDVSLCKK